MSALLAVERFADLCIARGHRIDDLIKLLMADCRNLAMPGLAVGVLIRHPDSVTNELDIWLSQPDAWSLEFHRLANEGHLHIQGPDDGVAGHKLRRSTLGQVVEAQVGKATLEDDKERISALSACGRSLMRRARSSIPGLDPNDDSRDYEVEELLTVANWSTVFDLANFRFRELSDGRIEVRIEPPQRLLTARQHLEARMSQAARYMHLLNAYACEEDRRSASETIREDLSLARSLVKDPPHDLFDFMMGPAAVAASAVLAHSDGTVALNEDELRWAANLLVSCACNPPTSRSDFAGSLHSTGVDRSAAAAVPALLILSAKKDLGAPSLRHVKKALGASTTSLFDEVRRITATALSLVWTTDCIRTGIGQRCLHSIALEAVEAGVRDCRLGPCSADGRRDFSPITERLPRGLDKIDPEDLFLSRLASPIIATSEIALN